MSRVFGDSFYFIALLNARDFHHQRAREITRDLPATIVTTRWVVAEVGNALSALGARKSFARFLEGLATQSKVVVLPNSDLLFESGALLFGARKNSNGVKYSNNEPPHDDNAFPPFLAFTVRRPRLNH